MITLPWPPRELSPNSRGHWAVKSKAAKAYRIASGWAAKAANVRIDGIGMIDVHIEFRPPSRRRYDWDNCIASCKAGLDGLADALGVNDSRFRLHIVMGEVVNGGLVLVTIKEGA